MQNKYLSLPYSKSITNTKIFNPNFNNWLNNKQNETTVDTVITITNVIKTSTETITTITTTTTTTKVPEKPLFYYNNKGMNNLLSVKDKLEKKKKPNKVKIY